MEEKIKFINSISPTPESSYPPLPKIPSINLLGFEGVRSLVMQKGFFVKILIGNERAAIFRGNTQHREAGFEGLAYKDDHSGNILAGTITEEKIEIRKHEFVSLDLARERIKRLLLHDDMVFARSLIISYGGEKI